MIWTWLQWWCRAGFVAKNTQWPGQLLRASPEALGQGRPAEALETPTGPRSPTPLPVRQSEDPGHPSPHQEFLERYGRRGKKFFNLVLATELLGHRSLGQLAGEFVGVK